MRFSDDSTDRTKFIGSEGWIAVSRARLDANPKSLLEPEQSRTGKDSSPAHAQNFIDCVKSRGRTVAHFEAAIRSDAISHLSNIAIRTGRKIKWDPVKETIVGDAEAARMLDRPVRAPWKV
jgi:hypothetical protein